DGTGGGRYGGDPTGSVRGLVRDRGMAVRGGTGRRADRDGDLPAEELFLFPAGIHAGLGELRAARRQDVGRNAARSSHQLERQPDAAGPRADARKQGALHHQRKQSHFRDRRPRRPELSHASCLRNSSSPTGGPGNRGSNRSKASTTTCATSTSLGSFLSAGTTYHGASGVLVNASMSW